jgi:hypothetical protein
MSAKGEKVYVTNHSIGQVKQLVTMITKYMLQRLVSTLIYRTIYVAKDIVIGPQYTTQVVHIPQ